MGTLHRRGWLAVHWPQKPSCMWSWAGHCSPWWWQGPGLPAPASQRWWGSWCLKRKYLFRNHTLSIEINHQMHWISQKRGLIKGVCCLIRARDWPTADLRWWLEVTGPWWLQSRSGLESAHFHHTPETTLGGVCSLQPMHPKDQPSHYTAFYAHSKLGWITALITETGQDCDDRYPEEHMWHSCTLPLAAADNPCTISYLLTAEGYYYSKIVFPVPFIALFLFLSHSMCTNKTPTNPLPSSNPASSSDWPICHHIAHSSIDL